MPIRLLTSGGGTTTIQPTTSASSVTLTIPSVNANVVTTGDTASVTQAMLGSGLAGTGPAFSAYASVAQSIPHSTWTRLQMNTEEFDTASCYDNATNYRFTPNVAGYYHVTGKATIAVAGTFYCASRLYKNGSGYYGGTSGMASAASYPNSVLSCLIYLNGTTDYIDYYVLHNYGSAQNTHSSIDTMLFQAYLVRAA